MSVQIELVPIPVEVYPPLGPDPICLVKYYSHNKLNKKKWCKVTLRLS